MAGRIFWIVAALVLAVMVGRSVRQLAQPCREPIRYRIGTIDSRFRVTAGELRNALRRAEAVWEDPVDRELFRYADDGELPVSLVYDERQQLTQENSSRRSTIERDSESAANLKRKYEAASREYDSARRSFDAARGSGADRAELERLRLAVNSAAERANQLMARYNEVAGRVNETVDAINQTTGRHYEQGVFERGPLGVRIDVFEFFNQEDLVRVLAHEFGHALGVDHNREPDSIMFAMNQSVQVRLSPEDIDRLRRICGFAAPPANGQP